MDTPRTVSAAEARANFSEIITEAGYAGRETVIERNSRPVAVVIGYDEYEAFRAFRAEHASARQAREARFAVYDRIKARNKGVPPEVVEQIVAEAVQATRKQKA
jgi:prevent-host-death family protein